MQVVDDLFQIFGAANLTRQKFIDIGETGWPGGQVEDRLILSDPDESRTDRKWTQQQKKKKKKKKKK
jgi:hypothetical protein